MYRKRALSVESEINQWTTLNPLFKNYVGIFEAVCGEGNPKTYLDNYVKREDHFEDDYAEQICTLSQSKFHKISILTGHVGIGKTTFIRYIRENIIHNKYHQVVTVYIDLLKLHEEYDKVFNERLIKSLMLKIEKLFDLSDSVIRYKYLKFYGFQADELSKNGKISSEFNSHVTPLYLLRFIDEISEKKYKKIIIFFDNLDENKKDAIKVIQYKIYEINTFIQNVSNNLCSLMVISIRDYNKRFFSIDFSKTNQYSEIKLPSVNATLVAKSKINEISETIVKMANSYTQPIIIGKTTEAHYTITKDGVVNFLNKLIDLIFDKQPSLVEFLTELSAGNLKILSSNILNVLQSKKLKLFNLFDYIFNKNTNLKTEDVTMSKREIIECLMAIRFPYYDVDKSKILNVFNVNNSNVRLDYANILVTPRLLFYIYNHEHTDITFNKVKNVLKQYGYNSDLIDLSINRCFGKGLFKTINGCRLDDIDINSDFIKLSSSGKIYIKDMIYQFSYLQYVCEDTPISPSLKVAISDKYPPNNNYSHITDPFKENRIKSVVNFINFLKKMEEIELEKLKKKRKNINNYLDSFSFRRNGEGVKFSVIIEELATHEIEKIKNMRSLNY